MGEFPFLKIYINENISLCFIGLNILKQFDRNNTGLNRLSLFGFIFLGWFSFLSWNFNLRFSFDLFFWLLLLFYRLLDFDLRLFWLLSLFSLFFAIGYLNQFTQIETIHVVNMRIYTLSFPQIYVVSFIDEFNQTCITYFDKIVNINYLYISFLKGIIYDLLVLKGRYGTCWVYHHSAYFCTVDCG